MTLHLFWWVDLPRHSRRLSNRVAGYLLDGLYWACWPSISAWLSPSLFFVGFLFGWLHPGYAQAFSESLFFLLIATAVGTLSGHLGLFLALGYGLGDFFLAHPEWLTRGSLLTNLWQVRIPLLIQYALLSILTVRVPLTTKILVDQLRVVVKLGHTVSYIIAFVSHMIFSVLLVYLWAQTVPLLIRPLFTWDGGSPPVSAMVHLQSGLWPLLLIAALASALRMIMQGLTAYRKPWQERYEDVLRRVVYDRKVEGILDRTPEIVRITGAAIVGAFLLSGMYVNFLDGLIVGSIIFVLQAARSKLIPVPLGSWPRIAERIPFLVRILLVGLSILLVSRQVLSLRVFTANTFRPILLLTILALILSYLLSPVRPGLLKEQRTS